MFPTLERLFAREKRPTIRIRPDYVQFFVCALIIGIYVLVMYVGAFNRLEKITLDYFFKFRPAPEIHSDIAIIEIDNVSIRTIGDWPWPPRYIAELVGILDEWGAKAMVFDFPLKDSGKDGGNQLLFENIKKAGNVYLPAVLEFQPVRKFSLQSLPIELTTGDNRETWIYSAPLIAEQAKESGHIHFETDLDGVLRRIEPVIERDSIAYRHMAVQVGADILGKDAEVFTERKLPLDQDGKYTINWVGPWEESFNRYSFTDMIRSSQAVLLGRTPIIPKEAIKDKICLIGFSADTSAKISMTPVQNTPVPYIAVHANVLNSVLTSQHIIPAPRLMNALCLLIMGVIISYLYINVRNVLSFVIGLVFGLTWLLVSFLFFCYQDVWLYVYYPIALILSLFIVLVIYSHVMANSEKARLLDLATRDGLTGLYVIRYFREVLNHVTREAHQKKIKIAIILMDIDNFKPVNDTYGHAAGDMVLKKVAAIVHSCLRAKRTFSQTDFVARYGGEEFVVLLRNSSLDNAADIVAERIRKSVEQGTFSWEGKQIPVTLSLGVSRLHSDDTVPDMMVRRADEALYEAKKTGKNKVCKEPPRD